MPEDLCGQIIVLDSTHAVIGFSSRNPITVLLGGKLKLPPGVRVGSWIVLRVELKVTSIRNLSPLPSQVSED